MVNITLQYIPYDTDIAFLKIKQDVIDVPFYKIAFFAHVYTAIFVLLAGFTQFSAKLRKNYPDMHRKSGWLYAAVVLLFAGPSGFFMGIFANGGVYSQISFCLLAILWFYFTLMALVKIKQGDIGAHRAFMIRSFALALSAITLRLWKYLIILSFDARPMDAYRIVAWLGWVPNLLLAEYIIHKFNLKRMRKLLYVLPLLILFSCGKTDTNNETANDKKKDEKNENQKSNSSTQVEVKVKKTAADFKYDPNLELTIEPFNHVPNLDAPYALDEINKFNASTTKLNKSDIANLYKENLEMIRNLIYARHGYIFKTENYENIFKYVDWYLPIYDDVSKDLTTLELENIDLLKRYEQYAKKTVMGR